MAVTIRENKNHLSKRLSVQVGLTGLSFYGFDGNGESFHYQTQLHQTTPEALVQEIFLLKEAHKIDFKTFNQLEVYHDNPWFTFVPKVFFKEELLPEYLKYNIQLQPEDYLVYDIIAGNDMVNVYLPFVNVNNYFLDHFGVFQYKHFSSVLIEKALKEEVGLRKQSIYLHLQKNTFYIIAIKQGKLQLFNLFEYQCAEDILYFVLNTAESVDFKTDFTLKISGQEPDAHFLALMENYIQTFQFSAS